jgi:hypothetical protein
VKKYIFSLMLLVLAFGICAQELFPYTEPASNMPSKSLSVKMTSMFEKGVHSPGLLQRHMPEVMLGLNKAWMVHASFTASDMHRQNFIFESVRFYGKYRFLSIDDVHKHFRMAAFGAASYSRNHLDHNELNLAGDHSGIQGGLIATQLWNKLALSATGSRIEVLKNERWAKYRGDEYSFSAMHYSLSAGYLLFPFEYKNYDQTNVNLYTEFLGSKNINAAADSFYMDLAPSLQFIFKSTGKLNIGYRFQLAGNVYRLARNSYMLSYEHIFLNALKRKRPKNL